MKLFTKVVCLLLVAVLVTVSFTSCGNKEKSSEKVGDNTNTTVVEENNDTADVDLIGTWKGSDHDGENIVHYLVFDEGGYWNVYMNYTPLVRAIRQLPGQLVSFKKFRDLQNSDHTKCFYEYVEGGSAFDQFSINENGDLVAEFKGDVTFTKSSESYEQVFAEAGTLFQKARDVIDAELKAENE